jgi:hypothetical protein
MSRDAQFLAIKIAMRMRDAMRKQYVCVEELKWRVRRAAADPRASRALQRHWTPSARLSRAAGQMQEEMDEDDGVGGGDGGAGARSEVERLASLQALLREYLGVVAG